MTECQKNRAFTLTELLVVLVLTALLISLAFSGVKSLLAASDNVRCVSNLRTIGQQSLTFFQERNGSLFPVWDWMGYEPFLSMLDIKQPYSGPESLHDTVLSCPGFKKAYPHIFPYPLNRSYSLNRWAHQYDVQSMQKYQTNNPIKPGNLINISNPSAMWMFMEGAQEDWGVFTYYNIGMKEYMGHPHAGGKKGNAVFFDAHVEAITPEMLDQYYKSDFWGGSD